jgi:hypothetical protein
MPSLWRGHEPVGTHTHAGADLHSSWLLVGFGSFLEWSVYVDGRVKSRDLAGGGSGTQEG